MQYPLISEYMAAIRDAHDNLEQLSHLVPVMDKYGEPYRSGGAFAVVFKMQDEQTGKCYALKCFTEEQEGRAEAYRQIAEKLEFVDSPYVTSVKYLEKELFVDSSCDDDEFPVLLMDWVEGDTMEAYIAAHHGDCHAMAMLCYRFCKLAAWLRSQPFAHGDIKPDNIMVRPDGTLTLVDYDGMFVPAMKGQKSPTIGTKDFSHPLRTIDDFDETIDDFALASIALSLKAISLDASLLEQYGAPDRLLFSATDYLNLSTSTAFAALQSLLADEEMQTLLSMFLLANAKKDLSMCSFRLFGLQKLNEEDVQKPKVNEVQKPKDEKVQKPKGGKVQKPKEDEVWSTKVTKKDLKNAVEDEFGVKYSKDWKRLLKAPGKLKGEYHIREGVKVIGDNAFYNLNSLTNINIPDSVTNIGNLAFYGCKSLTKIIIPSNVTIIGDQAFYGCHSLTNINIPNSVIHIGNEVFSWCESLTNINIPNSVTNIGSKAFMMCDSLTSINIPNSVTNIGDKAFYGCESLKSIKIPNSVTNIGDKAFYGCESLKSIKIPNSVTIIGDDAFRECI
ncbi:leucine-rich repeat protein [Hallella faecis]|uniref:leucine-rich repeat protein n=1 Tax=Hallella faecis TaxID=2841596 RepID=UPI003F8F80C5